MKIFNPYHAKLIKSSGFFNEVMERLFQHPFSAPRQSASLKQHPIFSHYFSRPESLKNLEDEFMRRVDPLIVSVVSSELTPNRDFERAIDYYEDPIFQDLFDRNRKLFQIVDQMANDYGRHLTLLFERISEQFEKICHMFFNMPPDEIVLSAIQFTNADLHHHGGMTIILKFSFAEKEYTLIYKPSPVAADAAVLGDTTQISELGFRQDEEQPYGSFYELLRHVAPDLAQHFIPYKILPCVSSPLEDAYGFIEYIPHTPELPKLQSIIDVYCHTIMMDSLLVNREGYIQKTKEKSSVEEGVTINGEYCLNTLRQVLISEEHKVPSEIAQLPLLTLNDHLLTFLIDEAHQQMLLRQSDYILSHSPCSIRALRQNPLYRNFMEQLGAIAAVAVLLRINDLHLENIIVTAKYNTRGEFIGFNFCLIDTEVAFQSQSVQRSLAFTHLFAKHVGGITAFHKPFDFKVVKGGSSWVCEYLTEFISIPENNALLYKTEQNIYQPVPLDVGLVTEGYTKVLSAAVLHTPKIMGWLIRLPNIPIRVLPISTLELSKKRNVLLSSYIKNIPVPSYLRGEFHAQLRIWLTEKVGSGIPLEDIHPEFSVLTPSPSEIREIEACMAEEETENREGMRPLRAMPTPLADSSMIGSPASTSGSGSTEEYSPEETSYLIEELMHGSIPSFFTTLDDTTLFTRNGGEIPIPQVDTLVAFQGDADEQRAAHKRYGDYQRARQASDGTLRYFVTSPREQLIGFFSAPDRHIPVLKQQLKKAMPSPNTPKCVIL